MSQKQWFFERRFVQAIMQPFFFLSFFLLFFFSLQVFLEFLPLEMFHFSLKNKLVFLFTY